MAVSFCKFHGFGNDYIVIENGAIAGWDEGDLAAAICHRNTGAGADGIAVLTKLDAAHADFFCEIINPDGSHAGFSGNGTRCAVAYLHYQGLWTETRLRLETLSGIKSYELTGRRGEGKFWFDAEVGKPRFASDDIPVTLDPPLETVIDQPIIAAGGQHVFSAVNVGNPVACVFVESFDMDWRSIGRAIETHEMFTERTNVVFVRVADHHNIEIRIWERGAGETSSSGTCSAGAAVMCSHLGKTGRRVNVHAEGGDTRIMWRADDEIIISGRADLAYCGEWPGSS